ncbi:uncharacterized protein Nmag_0674 [Natrialba magadii ATCC 43099]|uniref:Uncharacterized protein n=1 Tax=Natrialba magadii (strain ATCC 43099 / DSM 3394 / CCM 3739 / CIP 104546 / IAM 13178 / JCM 8861 / NBRC 102185 / NCIMB 2190 / MS3) TaxID=547559 RepID=D3SZC5_NATMM|nr:hypothetical protein [Natrialba magadii]ADD04259.1 uncharacterized protein Nmag_0674 [Natrialba magadii ATCC 43099]ELY26662.1 hypothetical protein C500_15915 [Natrialba magadii ATCC 43099]
MELDLPKTIAAFVLIIALGTAGLMTMPMGMAPDTILMMVMPSMVIFGAIMLVLGIKHGEYRATN